jgi:prepilin-type N-terminal cleavage/methylation domain-containing protein
MSLRRTTILAPPRDAGYSLIELIVGLFLMSSVLAIGVGFYPKAVAIVQGDADLRVITWQLKLARENAINQRRSMQLTFTSPNIISVVRRNIPNGTTVISTAVMEHNMQFLLFAGQPDTPDGFGRPSAVSFSGAAGVMFTADGMLTDLNGNPVNGSLFLGQPNKPSTSRALTVFGPTATIRAYRWNGTAWRH